MPLQTFSIVPTGSRNKSGGTSVKEGKIIKYHICRDDYLNRTTIELGVKNESAKGGKKNDYQIVTRNWARDRSGKRVKGSLLFKPGETCKTVKVKTYKDRIIEADESFSLYIKPNRRTYNVSSQYGSISTKILDRGWYGGGGGGSNGGNGSSTEGETEGNSNSNRSEYFVKDTYNFNEGEEAYFAIIRTKPRRRGSVNFTLSGYNESRWLQPAQPSQNYNPVLYTKEGGNRQYLARDNNNYNLGFKKGELEKTIYVETFRRDNDDCSFYALSIDIDEGRSQSSKYFEIKDVTEGENIFKISSQYKIREGETAKLVISRSDSCNRNGDRDIYLQIASGTADSSDYDTGIHSYSQKISFRNGQTEKVVEIPIIEDCIDEGEEYFYYSITGASQQDQTPRDDQGNPIRYKKFIVDKDVDESVNTFTINSAGKIKEGETAKFIISRSDPCDNNPDRDIYLHVEPGSAISSDYELGETSSKQMISFRNGETEKVVEIPISEDCTEEGDEYFYYSISGINNKDQTPLDDQGNPIRYKQYIEDADCQEEEVQPTKRRYWNDARSSWIDEVTADAKSVFTHDGTLLYASDDEQNSMQRIDRFILTSLNEGAQWKPEIQLRGAPSNTIVTIDVHPYFPDNLSGWEFKFYDDGFVNTTIDCYENLGLDHRASRGDVISDINYSYEASWRQYVNGQRLDSQSKEELINLSGSAYIDISIAEPGKAKEDGYFPGMGMGGPYCTDPVNDPISYTFTLTEVG